MTDPIRALCIEMAAELDHCRQTWMDDRNETHPLADRARAALAEPVAEPPAPPAEGEVAELVAWLHGQDGGLGRRAIYARIAELLERHAAPVPVPVPVSERLPRLQDCDAEGLQDCDAEGRCWLSSTAPGTFPGWILDDPEQCVDWDLWLPAHALPLPAPQGGEVEP